MSVLEDLRGRFEIIERVEYARCSLRGLESNTHCDLSLVKNRDSKYQLSHVIKIGIVSFDVALYLRMDYGYSIGAVAYRR